MIGHGGLSQLRIGNKICWRNNTPSYCIYGERSDLEKLSTLITLEPLFLSTNGSVEWYLLKIATLLYATEDWSSLNRNMSLGSRALYLEVDHIAGWHIDVGCTHYLGKRTTQVAHIILWKLLDENHAGTAPEASGGHPKISLLRHVTQQYIGWMFRRISLQFCNLRKCMRYNSIARPISAWIVSSCTRRILSGYSLW